MVPRPVLVVALLAACTALIADDAHGDAAAQAFFESRIRPVLIDHCYRCHSADSERLKGGLRVDTRAGLLSGGDSGPGRNPPSCRCSTSRFRAQAKAEYDAELAAARRAVDERIALRHGEVVPALRSVEKLTAYLLAVHEGAGLDDGGLRALAERQNLRPALLERWRAALRSGGPVFAAWNGYAALPGDGFADAARALTPAPEWNPLVRGAFVSAPTSPRMVAERYAALFAAHAGDAVESDEAGEALRQALRGDGAPTAIALAEAEAFLDGEDHRLLRELRKKADEVISTHRGSPPRAMALADVPEPVTPRVFIRGDPGNHGAEVPRRFLTILSGPQRAPFVDGSGRLELARAIASADNPLTARVLVNRVWAQHFATGLVATPSDFGLRGDPPSDRALLDWLALRFVADGWSIKSLHRLILASATYQQASDHADADMASKIDPDNRLLWRTNRRRLDFEALRDGLLAVAGALDPTMGGRAIDLTQPDATRRTVYGFIDRQNLANLFRTFDFASPDAHSPRRHLTSVPQQALYLMNSPFAVTQAKRLARLSEDAGTDPVARVRRLLALVHAREATDDELAVGAEYIAACARLPSGPPAPPQPVWSYGFGGLDPQTQRVAFTAFAFFVNDRWAPAASMPDERLGWLSVLRDGGHPGRDDAHAAIRRWTAPRDATIAIAGTLKRPETQGDGIAGRIVASGAGVLGAWTIATGEVATAIERLAVRRGDHIDFIVDPCGDDGWDSFQWSPAITAIDDQDGEWKAAEAYAGPPEVVAALTPWEKYAQALLMSNEFAFID